MTGFHEVRFPIDIARGARGGPQRLTEIVTLASGREVRNSRWERSRRRWDAGLGIRTLDALGEVLAFFEERRGRLHGFRWRDALDCRSCAPTQEPSSTDQAIGVGDGANRVFRLAKTYGGADAPYRREVDKPVAGSVLVAVDGISRTEGAHFTCDATTGTLTFSTGATPPAGSLVTAGFLFDVPVRFDTDVLDIDLSAFAAGEIPQIPVIEIQL